MKSKGLEQKKKKKYSGQAAIFFTIVTYTSSHQYGLGMRLTVSACTFAVHLPCSCHLAHSVQCPCNFNTIKLQKKSMIQCTTFIENLYSRLKHYNVTTFASFSASTCRDSIFCSAYNLLTLSCWGHFWTKAVATISSNFWLSYIHLRSHLTSYFHERRY